VSKATLEFVLILCLFATLAAGASASQTDESPALRCVTFNIRYDNPDDGVHAWPERRERVIELIESFDADVMGVQEVLPHQRAYLESRLDGYTFRGVGRTDGEKRGEQSPVAYRTGRFEELGFGTWWLSPTPGTPSRGWDAALPRIATWLRLRDKQSDERILVVCTHFDHRGEQARRESAKLLHEKLKGAPRVILLGDFNATPGSKPHRTLSESFADAAGDDDRATWCGWDGKPDPGRRIDWILLRGFEVTAYDVPAWRDAARPESDHLPVVATVELKSGASERKDVHDTRSTGR